MYHVRISTKSDPYNDETKIDLDEAQLRSQFVEPYELGQPIVVNGRVIEMTDLDRIRIGFNELPSESVRARIQLEDQGSTVFVVKVARRWSGGSHLAPPT